MASRQRTSDADKQISVGRPSKYPGKNREKPIQVYLTDKGRAALDRGCARRDLSRPDYIEELVLKDDEWYRNWRKAQNKVDSETRA